MFSLKQKQEIARKVEDLLLAIGHPEMPTEKADFTLNVSGKEGWSWAIIRPNWTFDKANPPGVNPHNEAQAERSKT
jgi:hypothetical protein